MAGPTVGAVGTVHSGSTDPLNVPIPAGVVDGSVVVVVAYLGSITESIATPALDFVNAPDSPWQSQPAAVSTNYVMWHRASGPEGPGSYSFDLTANVFCEAVALRVDGCIDGVNPFEDTAVAIDQTFGTITPAVAVTTLGPDRLLLWAATNWAGGSWTQPAGYTEDKDSGVGVNTVAHVAQALAGSSGPVTGVVSNSDRRTAWLGALLPEGVIVDGAAAIGSSLVVAASGERVVDATMTVGSSLVVQAFGDVERGTTVPVQNGPCSWPIEFDCAPDWATIAPGVQAFATAFAKQVMWALSGRQYGLCPLTIRPCRKPCSGSLWPPGGWWDSSSLFVPQIVNGTWLNTCTCNRRDNCSCSPLCEVRLPGPVHDITQVKIDGVVVDPGAYMVYDWKDLTRIDGECWPDCQDMTAGVDDVGSFVVEYQRGIAPPTEVGCLTGMLANEIAKACTGAKCRLDRTVSSLTRQGVSKNFVPLETLLKLKLTGLPEIDMWLTAVNPGRLDSDSIVWSPDLKRGRQRTS